MPRQIKLFSVGIFVFLTVNFTAMGVYLVFRDHGLSAFLCQTDCGQALLFWKFVGITILMGAGIGILAVVLLAPIIWMKAKLKP